MVRLLRRRCILLAALLGLIAPMSFASAQTVVGWGAFATPPADLGPVIQIAAGGSHYLALQSDGTVRAWGFAANCQTNVPVGLSNVVAIAAGDYHSLALRTDGRVTTWGCDTKWELGAVPGEATNVVQISAGQRHSLAVRADGTVVAWGVNDDGQCDVPDDLHAVAIAAGGAFSVAVKPNRTVVVWGNNFFGQCRPPEGLREVVAIAAGSNHALALRTDGTVIAWGDNSYGQCDLPAGLTGVSAISAYANYSLALKTDGTVVSWGWGGVEPPAGLANVVGIAAGNRWGLALVGTESPYLVRGIADYDAVLGTTVTFAAVVHGAEPLGFQWFKDGQILADGDGLTGTATPQLVIEKARLEDSAQYWLVASNASGTVTTSPARLDVITAPRIERQPEALSQSLGSVAVLSLSAAGAEPLNYQWFKDGAPLTESDRISGTAQPELRIDRLGYADEGAYLAVISNIYGSATSRVAQISVSQVVSWGDDDFGQTEVPPGLRDVVAIAAGDSHTLALHEDGTISAWGEESDGQTTPPDEPLVAVAAGRFHSLGLRANGTVVAWGRNRSGQCDVPASLSNVVAIAAGGAHSLALRADGTVVAWGRTAPAPGLSNVVAIAAGNFHSVALRANGEVVAWGYNRAGQCVVPPDLNDVVRIAAGGFHSLALRRDGTVVAWGLNRSGQCDVPPGLSNVVAIAAGGHHSLAIRADGLVVAWGLNQTGQRDAPTDFLRAKAIAAGRVHSLAVAGEGQPEFLRPIGVEAVAGGGVRLQGFPLGDAPITYQWFRGEQPLSDSGGIAGVDTPVLLLEPEAATSDLYSLHVVNALGEARSVPADLSTALGPRLRLLPSGREVLQGSRVLLAADVEGALPMTFQWLLNGVPLSEGTGVSGTTSPVLEIQAITPGDVGEYRLTATNAYGVTVSASQDLTVCNIRAWGDNRYGQSMLPYPLRGIKAISALADHALALREDGTVVAWGDNSWKQCEIPPGLSYVVEIAAGEYHSMALRADGTLQVWGGPTRGLQVLPPSVTNVTAIAAEGRDCLALRSDGQVLWWKAGNPSTLTTPWHMPSSIPITGGKLRTLLTQRSARGGVLGRLGPVLDIAIGSTYYPIDPTYYHALTSDGQVCVWSAGSSASVPAFLPLENITEVAAGEGQDCLALSADGQVIHWQAGQTESAAFTEIATNAVAIAVGRDFQLALTARGEVVEAGGMVLPPTDLHDIVGLSAGGGHSLAVRANGSVVAWGGNYSGQCAVPAGLSNVVAVAAGDTHSLVLKADGTVAAWGDNHLGQCDVPPNLTNVVSIGAGAGHNLALLASGTITAWGDNAFGQCSVPADLPPALAIAAGASHSMALRTDGTVATWGLQMALPEGLSNVVAIAAGKLHSAALRRDGTVVAWGNATAGSAEVMNWSNIVAIAAGGMNTVGLKGDGSVVVAGKKMYGQNDVPTDLRNVDLIAAGDGCVLAATGAGPLARALGGPGLAWRTGGQQPWIAQMQVTRDGPLAAQSGAVQPGEESWLETTVRGPGVLRFWWRLAPAGTTASLELLVNGAPVAALTQATDWEPKAVGVSSGLSTVRWRYTRESGTPEPDSGAWLDAVEFSLVEPPMLSVLWVDASQVAVRFDTVEGLTYVLQSASAIQGKATEWNPVSIVVGSGQPAVVPVQIGDGATRFFRLVTE